jgi:hypothetical protein
MHRKQLLTVITATILLGVGIGSFVAGRNIINNAAPLPTTTPAPTSSATASTGIVYEGESGKTALELLKKNHTVTEDTSAMGTFVKAIDGKEAHDGQYWAFYLNGTYSVTPAAGYLTKSTDHIEWKYENTK